jgi:transcription elongation factor Elf1
LNRENKIKARTKGYYRTHASDESFVCKTCGFLNVSHGAGSGHRNHCSNCLTSQHLDVEPGDREADCGGVMEPIGVWIKKDGEWAIIHRCKRCGHLSSNRVAADDNPLKLMSVALRPVSNPPFPLERIKELAVSLGGE